MDDHQSTPLWSRQNRNAFLIGAGAALIVDAVLFVYVLRSRPADNQSDDPRIAAAPANVTEPISGTIWIDPPSDDNRPTDVYPGEFCSTALEPPELQFSCAVGSLFSEDYFAKRLTDAKLDFDSRLKAAEALWRGRSRRNASNVFNFVSTPAPQSERFESLRSDIDKSLQPTAILAELQEGDYLWGSWLAYLRPHKDLVPILLTNLNAKPDKLHETMLALASTGDRRALDPLLELLASKDYQIAGNAAQALGYLGFKEAEPKLIESLAPDNGWRQVNAAAALAKMGTARSLPALDILAKDQRYTGTLAIRSMAERAIDSIKKRDKRL